MAAQIHRHCRHAEKRRINQLARQSRPHYPSAGFYASWFHDTRRRQERWLKTQKIRFMCVKKAPVKWWFGLPERRGHMKFGEDTVCASFEDGSAGAVFWVSGFLLLHVAFYTMYRLGVPDGIAGPVYLGGLVSWVLLVFVFEALFGAAILVTVSPTRGRAYYARRGQILGIELVEPELKLDGPPRWMRLPSRVRLLGDWLVVRTRPDDQAFILEWFAKAYGDRFEVTDKAPDGSK